MEIRAEGVMEIVGWDIGGAHLKLARVRDGTVVAVRQLPCALWQGVGRLAAAMSEGRAGWPAADSHAVTMTGELADIFPDRAQGVRGILATLTQRIDPSAIAVYANDGVFRSAERAADNPARVASANWHASARLAAARLGGGLLVDVGSTTTDIVPFRGGTVVAQGGGDAARLASDELVYRGVVRTPIMAAVQHVEIDGMRSGVMAEYFATMADVYRLTGELPDHADQHATADGRGKSVPESAARLARMVGRDPASAPAETWRVLARSIADRQLQQLEAAAMRVITAAALPIEAPLIGAGVGRFLAQALAWRLDRPYRSFERIIDASDDAVAAGAADAAPAAAVALLLGDELLSNARSRATAAESSGASRAPRVSAERKPR
jgi:(4-(4-[2-(gamma-L-glutamylamino)ethyl]phenoxymethyl)furan-2-yl)methanamine synthase